MDKIVDEIKKLKKEKNIAILAHYYVRDEIQELADYIGDSFYLSKKALELEEETLVFCGVSFMAETAKILAPEKTILFPNHKAKCPMVDMADRESVLKAKEKYPDSKIISYVNSSTEIKALSDACCTSSNAYNIVKNIEGEEIIFIPDKHLGSFIQEEVKDKTIRAWNGFCPFHDRLTYNNVKNFLNDFPGKIEVLAHPECRKEVRDLADFVGSTSKIINYAGESESKDFLILTEKGILYQLKTRYPNKNFHHLNIYCDPMKAISLKDLYESMAESKGEITLDEELRSQAQKALDTMLELA